MMTKALVYGVGINDADYAVKPLINGKRNYCPFYKSWMAVLERCYSSKLHEKFPTYIGCTICIEWTLFSRFKKWMEDQDWQGKELDKDIIKPGNKVYSPENCCFVDSSLNRLLVNVTPKSVGVYPAKSEGAFSAQCYDGNGNLIRLGTHPNRTEARKAYINFKVGVITRKALEQNDARVSVGLMKHASTLVEGLRGGRNE